MAKTTAKAEMEVAASPSEVYWMFTNSTAAREWLADAALITPRPQGRFYLSWNDGYQTAGTITEFDPDTGLAFTWQGPGEAPTEVKVSWQGTEAGTRVAVRHSGFEKKAQRRELEEAWQRSLENLASVLATGEDLRFTRRPMLGVYIEAESRGEDGAVQGVQIGGVVEGLGAAKAGLLGGDVITGFGGNAVRSYADLGAAAARHRSGDIVAVSYLREGEPHTAEMILSGRQIGDVRMTAGGLASQVEEINGRFLGGLTAVLAGVAEDAANRRPAEGEWSAKEVLAHILDGEGDLHSFIVEAFEGSEPLHDVGLGNSHWRTRVTANAYPDVNSMMEAYRRLGAETVELIRTMPPEFEQRKSTFWRFAYNFSEGEPHLQEHLDQIRAALAVNG
ncbi:MAG TPA: SRPBCC domain-containing protein [Acidimicrobiia bacterium]|nr:SRPBCC domain-containing protein [Acidimicrobiia bacterium]